MFASLPRPEESAQEVTGDPVMPASAFSHSFRLAATFPGAALLALANVKY